MALKHFITFLLIGVLVMAIPQAKAQLGLQLLEGLIGLVNIQGTVFCTHKDKIDVKGGTAPVFPNAHVQLLCGGKEISNGATGADGKFTIKVDPLLLDLSSFLTGCNVVVATPLFNCNASLPSVGSLISNLEFTGINRIGTQTIANITPSGFHFVPSP